MADKKRLFKLAEEIKREAQDIIQYLKSVGIEGITATSHLDADKVLEIKEHFSTRKSKAKKAVKAEGEAEAAAAVKKEKPAEVMEKVAAEAPAQPAVEQAPLKVEATLAKPEKAPETPLPVVVPPPPPPPVVTPAIEVAAKLSEKVDEKPKVAPAPPATPPAPAHTSTLQPPPPQATAKPRVPSGPPPGTIVRPAPSPLPASSPGRVAPTYHPPGGTGRPAPPQDKAAYPQARTAGQPPLRPRRPVPAGSPQPNQTIRQHISSRFGEFKPRPVTPRPGLHHRHGIIALRLEPDPTTASIPRRARKNDFGPRLPGERRR